MDCLGRENVNREAGQGKRPGIFENIGVWWRKSSNNSKRLRRSQGEDGITEAKGGMCFNKGEEVNSAERF